MSLDQAHYRELIDARVFSPDAFATALLSRSRRPIVGTDGRLIIIAADHTARGKISLGSNPVAMADRYTLLDRLVRCLAMPEVDGVLASADILEELAWLGALNGKLAIGTMNRGGIIGATVSPRTTRTTSSRWGWTAEKRSSESTIPTPASRERSRPLRA